MDILGGYVLFAVVAWLSLVAFPFVIMWVGFRIVRHLYHISVALFQIRDSLRSQQPTEASVPEPRHVVNSMFGR